MTDHTCTVGIFTWKGPQSMNGKARERLEQLEPWWAKDDRVGKYLIPYIVHGAPNSEYREERETVPDPDVPLRALEYLLTNWSKERQTSIKFIEGGQDYVVNVNTEYTSQMRMWGKPLLDVFRRMHHRVYFDYKGREYYTTVAQLNMFEWLVTRKVYAYALASKTQLLEKMHATNRANQADIRKHRERGVKRKRQVLSKPPRSTTTVVPGRGITQFNSN